MRAISAVAELVLVVLYESVKKLVQNVSEAGADVETVGGDRMTEV